MSISPVNDRVLLEPIELENKSAGGIVLSALPASPRLHAKVLAIGPGRQNTQGALIPIVSCSVGDIVAYGNVNSTIEDRLDNGTKVLLIVADAIVAIIGE